MKYLDLGIQTIILVVGIVILLVSWGEADWPFGILYVQLLLGPWQMMSSVVSVVAKAPLYRKKRLHLFLAIIYLFALYIAGHAADDALVQRFFGVAITVPAWALAIYYYILTCRWVFPRRRSGGNFLPNLSF